MRKLIVIVIVALGVLLLVPAASAWASPQTFYVHPSGGNDTHNIQQAFNAAVKAGPGSTVQLSAGHFYTNTIVASDFRGTFRGAGEGATFIDSLQALAASEPPVTIDPAVEPYPFLIGFRGGDVCVSDLTADITSPTPAVGLFDGTSTALADVFLVTDSANASFKHMAVIANSGDAEGYNVWLDVEITGLEQTNVWDEPYALSPTSGVDAVTDCSFTGRAGIECFCLTDGRLTVGGSAAQQNVFNVASVGCIFTDNSNSDIEVSHNQMQCSLGQNLLLWQGAAASNDSGAPLPPKPAPRYLIADNSMLCTGTAGGVWVEDDSSLWSAVNRLHAVIADNAIHLDNDGWDAGIDGLYAQGIWVLHNRICGTGLAAVDVGALSLLGLPSAPASGWKIIGNDVSGLTATGDQYGISTAQIWLGPDADHCLVVGGCRPTQVLDQGTDDTLINVTKLPLPATAPASPMGQTKRMLMKGVLP